MSKYSKMAVVAAVALTSLSFSPQSLKTKTLCAGFLPPNSMSIPVGDVHAAGISQDMFNKVLDKVQKIYGPIIASKGGTLKINRLWEDPTVNASAQQNGSTWIINMYGGLARHAAVTEEGFALVACHELGHHIGGYPKMDWATNEGGADYYATLKCLRRYFGGSAPSGAVDPVAAKACQSQFSDAAGRNTCGDNALAGQSVAFLFQALRGADKPPSFGTPDPSVVDQMDDSHPDTQCRLDTYFQGGLCQKSLGEDVSNDDPTIGGCTRKGGYKAGLRPRCWYKPPADEPEGAPAMASKPVELPSAEGLKERIEALRSALSGRGV